MAIIKATNHTDIKEKRPGLSSKLDQPDSINTSNLSNSGKDPAYGTVISSVSGIGNPTAPLAFNPLTARIKYPHTAIGSFIHAFRDHINYSVYNDFQGIIFGSYSKSIQRYLQRLRYENESNIIDLGLPIFSYTLQLDGVDDKVDSPWRSTTFLPGLGKGMYKPFYEDKDFTLSVIYRRLKGTINGNIYCSSQAELLDIEMAFLDAFRGINVYNQTEIRAMTILPSHVLFTDVHGRRISQALTSNKITKSFIPAINEEQYYIYNNTSAIINMTAISENSSYHGGNALPEFNLTSTFGFEIEIPQYILCMAKPDITSIELNMDIAYKYEDKRVLKAIEYITGKFSGKKPFENNYDHNDKKHIKFERGEIIDSAIITINKDNINKIPLITSIFPDRKNEWSYKNTDIIIIILYAGGVIRVPIDNAAASYDENGDIDIKLDLFNEDDYVEIFVFRINPDLVLSKNETEESEQSE